VVRGSYAVHGVCEVLREISPSYPAMTCLVSLASRLVAPRETFQSMTHQVAVRQQPVPQTPPHHAVCPRGHHVAFLGLHRVASHKLLRVAGRPHEAPLAIPPHGAFPNVSLVPHSASRRAYYPLVSPLSSPSASSPASPSAQCEFCHGRAPTASQAVFRVAHYVSPRSAE